jgi:hypothetical protein
MNKRFNTSSNLGGSTVTQIATPTIDFSGKTKTKVNRNTMDENLITEGELLQFFN